MSLAPGARLGPYEILSAIGAGGMGEVYRARDTRLGREVAIKILPDLFAGDTDRIARFQREAQVLASLNHPHIAQIYGVEEATGGVRALVLELVDGPTLADRIAQGPIPIDEALTIARQIAEALEAAHDNGIVHRDLKPANIKLAHDGAVKVLDFGLAKALERTASGTSNMLSASPTLTSPAMATNAGVILGTAVYMSPEQAKGKTADKRSDIWAFGCVLYEMLTGRRAFDGEDLTDVVAAVVRGEPDWAALPADVPAHVRTLLKGCFQKDRKARLGDIAVVRFLLDQGMTLPAGQTSSVKTGTRSRAYAIWAAALVLISASAVFLLWRPRQVDRVPAPLLRLTANIGADASLLDGLGASSVLSPDGTVMAFVAAKNPGEGLALYVRRLDQLQATLLSGTEGAANPFFSPDGKAIGFFSNGKLRKVPVAGGSPVTLCDAAAGRGGSWAPDGSIYFTPVGGPKVVIQRVSSDGGTPANIVPLGEGEATQRWPQVLPGGRTLLFTSSQTLGNYATANIIAQPLPDGPRKVLVKGATYGRYVESGHLLYFRDRTLFAVPFDLATLEVTGPAVPFLENVRVNGVSGGAQFDASSTGTLVYAAAETVSDTSPIQWLDRRGQLSVLRSVPANWSNPAFSPDGRLLAVDIHDGAQSDIWIYDWARDTLSRRTFHTADDQRPVWSPDSARIAFASRRNDSPVFNIYWQRADGTGDAERLTTSPNSQFPTSFHPSGRILAFMDSVGNSSDVMMLPIEGDEKNGFKGGVPSAFLNAPYQESSAMFSPDGRWVAYLSNEGGRLDIFVNPYPGPGGKVQISSSAADDPTWSRATPEFFFVSAADFRIMVMPYRTEGSAFHAGKPVQLNATRIAARPRTPSRDLDLHPDGKRFAVAGTEDQSTQRIDKVVFVFNFFDELRRIAPAKSR